MNLNDIAWSFTKEFYTDAGKFDSEVVAHQKGNHKEANRWDPVAIVSDFPELQIQYTAWVTGAEDLLENEVVSDDDQGIFDEEPEEDEYGYQVDILATLTANNGKYFTALEFLMKTHNQMANKELGDHVFFEGIDETPELINGLPTYYISCGS